MLGLASGAIVLGVALSGAIYVFEEELRELYQHRYTRVPPRDASARLAPSELRRRGDTALLDALGTLGVVDATGLGISLDPSHAATYWGHREKPHVFYQAYLDPYTGDVLAVRNMDWDPLQLVRDFHQSLLLPYDIGHQIVGWSVVVFLVMLATGLCLWWPRRSSRLHPGGLRAKFTIRWRSRFRRLNYDLHSVVGFWVLSLGIIIAVTGLVWSFPWVDRAIYWVATGGRVKVAPLAPKSDRQAVAEPRSQEARAIDLAFAEAARRLPAADRFYVELSRDETAALTVWGVEVGNASETASYRWSGLHFDRYAGTLLATELYRDLDRGQKLSLMNYSIHVGKILGLPGQLLALAASLVVASLPVTGFLLWWNRGRRAREAPSAAPAGKMYASSGGDAGATH